MASSSLSQEDLEADYETSARRTRVRTARARNVTVAAARNAPAAEAPTTVDGADEGLGSAATTAADAADYDALPKPTAAAAATTMTAAARAKDKRTPRPNHGNKGKQQRDRRKLREKRRSTGVVHLPSTESTGGSTGEDEGELLSLSAETKRNTLHNELVDRENNIYHIPNEERLPMSFSSRRDKSPSDLEADDEDNQDYDSAINPSNSNFSLMQEMCDPRWSRNTNGRAETPPSDSLDELLERAREENRHLLEVLENKDKKIVQLEKDVHQLTQDLQNVNVEHDKLKEENDALVRAMAQLAVK